MSGLQQPHSTQQEHVSQPTIPEFQPTVAQTTQPLTIPSRRPITPQQDDSNLAGTFTKEEWEQDLDIKLVFRYLRSRFISRSSSSSPGTAHLATTTNQDTAAKAARVRQHHPLVSRSRPATERRTFKATTPSSPVALRHGHASSCASQSTRRSARRSSVSSRHYWDIGGSLGTGSMIAFKWPHGEFGVRSNLTGRIYFHSRGRVLGLTCHMHVDGIYFSCTNNGVDCGVFTGQLLG